MENKRTAAISRHMNLLYRCIGGHEGISKLLRHFYADVGEGLVVIHRLAHPKSL
jgi:hypothetical protein